MIVPRVGLPVDAAQWAAVAIGAATLAWSARIAAFARRNERRAVIVLAALAAALSWLYVVFYLRGAPRIIDATSYYLSARGLAEGHVTFPAPDPETSVLGRFLVRSEDAAGARAAVLFPPGYPMVLALGFLVGAPMLVGPAIAAALVFATHALAKEVTRDAPRFEGVPLTAAALGVACAALRYHTADTMSHGLAALTFTLAVTSLLRARRLERDARSQEGAHPRPGYRPSAPPAATGRTESVPRRRSGAWLRGVRSGADAVLDVAPKSLTTFAKGGEPFGVQRSENESVSTNGGQITESLVSKARGPVGSAVIAGLAGGLLFATRPASGLAFAATALVILLSQDSATPLLPRSASVRRTAKMLVAVAVGAIPMLVVYAVHQRLATGRWLTSTHAAHYALNDGPAGCFRYGFGEGIGCYGEHADFVRANLPRGFGLVPAIKTTARRLWMHLVDPANAEPLALLVPAGAALAWRRPGVRAIAIATLLLIAAYVPFYFDGNYPGGGARLYADALPFEHVLLAIAATAIAARRYSDSDLARATPRFGAALVGLVLIAFGVRAGFDHAMLRDRDGGAPLFSDAAALSAEQSARSAGGRGLLFVDTDAAFNLAFDPDARDEGHVEVARRKGDALDRVTWIAHGSPSFVGLARFVEDPSSGRGHVEVTPYPMEPLASLVAIDAGSLWPPRAQEGSAFALPTFAGGTCAKAARPLRVLATEPGGVVRVGLPDVARGRSLSLTLLLATSPTIDATSPTIDATSPTIAKVPSVALGVEADGAPIYQSPFTLPPGPLPSCVSVFVGPLPKSARRVDITVTPLWRAPADPEMQPFVALDRIELRDASP
ncbi:MAG: hypothetical protein U0441_14270 [Polyangiaceae bacterium]